MDTWNNTLGTNELILPRNKKRSAHYTILTSVALLSQQDFVHYQDFNAAHT